MVHGRTGTTNFMENILLFIIHCNHKANISLNACVIYDSCQSKTKYLTLEEVSDSKKRCVFESDLLA